MKFPTGVTLPVNYSMFSLNVFEKTPQMKIKNILIDSQPQVIKYTSCLPMVGGSLQVLRLLLPLKLVAMI